MKFRSQIFCALGLLLLLLGSRHARAQQEGGTPPIVRDIEVQYAGPATVSKERIIANMRTKVGKYYSQPVADEDVRNIYAMGNIENVRIYGQAMADGVKVIVVVQTKA